jgi:RecA/RadA recombinase
MAKKKTDADETAQLSQAELETKFSEENSDSTEKENPKKIKIKSKSNFSLNDYKKRVQSNTVSFKEQTWIKMSEAFQELTGLPGIPEGHVIQVFGRSDTGKTTLLIEAALYAQKQGILPVFIITEKKWSWDRIVEAGFDIDNCIYKDDVDTIEEGCDFMQQILRDQEEGRLPHDLVFLWDSIGATPSKAEFNASEADLDSMMKAVEDGKEFKGAKGGGMMVTARVLRERITRNLSHKISATRKQASPYNSTFIIVNHAYQAPPSFPGGVTTLVPYGGDGIYLAATLVFRMGGVMSNSSKVKAIKDGQEISFAIKSSFTIAKNHISEGSADGKIICTPHGFIKDDKKAIDKYKEQYKAGWMLEYDKHWDKVSLD